MDIDIEVDYCRSGSGKGIYRRLGPRPSLQQAQPDQPVKVCYHWQAGRCSRHPCMFLHSEAPTMQDSRSSNSFKHQKPVTACGKNGGHRSKRDNARHADSIGKTSIGGQVDKRCKHFLSGSSCRYGDRCKFLHAWSTGDSFSLLASLEGHQEVIKALALPSGSDKLYSASKDGTVKAWDCHTGQCVATVSMGHEVGSMISEEPWLFVGIPDCIKVWNTQNGTEMSLPGPSGQVYALMAADNMLFAGTQDGRILVWKFNAATNSFEPAASLVGHRLAVISLVVGHTTLYSGSMDNTVKAWDMATLQCMQTLSNHTNAIMSLLCWDEFLLSCSLDNTVKIWVTNNKEQLEVAYTHTEKHGVISLCGMHDSEGKPVLMCALNDNTVRLYDLSSFNERGRIFSLKEVRSLETGPGGLFFFGDGNGNLKVWRWSDR